MPRVADVLQSERGENHVELALNLRNAAEVNRVRCLPEVVLIGSRHILGGVVKRAFQVCHIAGKTGFARSDFKNST